MNLKKTLFLAIVLTLAFIYILKVEMPAEEAEQVKDFAFKNLSGKEIDDITISRKGNSWKLHNLDAHNLSAIENGRWEVDGIRGSDLDAGALNSIISALKDLKLENQLPKEDLDSDLSVYGLDKPEIKIKLNYHGTSTEISLGKMNDYISRRYLRLSGNQNIYLVNDTLYTAANKELSELRDKTPLNFFDKDLKSISIKFQGSKEIRLKQAEDRTWQLEEPVSAPASGSAVSEFNTSLRNLRAKEFIDDGSKIADYNLDKNELVIRLEAADDKLKNRDLIFSKGNKTPPDKDKGPAEDYYMFVQGGATIYKLEADPFKLFLKSSDDFRNKNVFQFSTDKVTEAEVLKPEKILLKRENNQWKVNGKEGDKVFIDQWLNNLSDLKAVGFPEKTTDLGFENPQFKLSIKAGDLKRELLVGKSYTEHPGAVLYFAATEDLSNPFTISEDTLKIIALKEEALLPQQAIDPAAQAQVVQDPAEAAKQ